MASFFSNLLTIKFQTTILFCFDSEQEKYDIWIRQHTNLVNTSSNIKVYVRLKAPQLLPKHNTESQIGDVFLRWSS